MLNGKYTGGVIIAPSTQVKNKRVENTGFCYHIHFITTTALNLYNLPSIFIMKNFGGVKGILVASLLIISLFTFTFSNADDTTPPEIKDVMTVPSTAWQGEIVAIQCKVYDDVAVNRVKVIVKYPDDSVINMTMRKSGDIYMYKQIYMLPGTYTYHIWANDTSGNSNISANYTFVIMEDNYAPNTHCILSGVEGENGWFVGDVEITLYATDKGTGVKDIWYYLDEGPWLEYEKSFKVSSEGEHDIYYYAEDNVGNIEKTKHTSFKIDKTVPQTNCDIYGTMGNDGWYITNVTIVLSAKDNISGVNKTFYKIDEGEWKLYNGSFIVSENGEHTIYYYSVDKAGNEEKERSKEFKIDTVTPIVEIKKPKEGYLYFEDREIMPTITGKTVIIGRITIEAEASNGQSGINRVEFFVDSVYQYEDNQPPYEWTWDYFSIGTHLIETIAYDNAGNSASDQLLVFVINL